MNNLTYQILTLVISLIGVVLTGLVVPWLKTKISNEKLTSIESWVNIAVAAAEQMKAAGILTVPKKDYVLAFIKDKGITITDQELDALIEAAVFELNKAQNLLFTDLALQDGLAILGETSEIEN
jgi:peroxiredoxin